MKLRPQIVVTYVYIALSKLNITNSNCNFWGEIQFFFKEVQWMHAHCIHCTCTYMYVVHATLPSPHAARKVQYKCYGQNVNCWADYKPVLNLVRW